MSTDFEMSVFCLSLEKDDSLKAKRDVRKTNVEKKMYYDVAIRLHFELGYGEDRIAEILPIGHTTAWRWIRKFAAENKDKTTAMARTKKAKTAPKASNGEAKDDIQSLKAELSKAAQEEFAL